MDIKAKVLEVSRVQQVSEKLQKRELIVEYAENEKYPETIKFECINDKCALLDNVRPGDNVEVSFNLRGRAWTDKVGKTSYFNSLQLWKIVIMAAGQSAKQPEYAAMSSAPDEDDIPF